MGYWQTQEISTKIIMWSILHLLSSWFLKFSRCLKSRPSPHHRWMKMKNGWLTSFATSSRNQNNCLTAWGIHILSSLYWDISRTVGKLCWLILLFIFWQFCLCAVPLYYRYFFLRNVVNKQQHSLLPVSIF